MGPDCNEPKITFFKWLAMKISVAHPQVQHSHQLVCALNDALILDKYYTSCFFDPEKYRWLPKRVFEIIRKRSNEFIPYEKVETFPFVDILWKTSGYFLPRRTHEKLFYSNVWSFDSVVARKLKNSSANIVVGYENSTRDIFRAAKRLGKICVLDAASVHFNTQKSVYRPNYSSSFLDKVNARKLEETQLADHILVLSDFAKKSYVENGIEQGKISIVPLGVNYEIFKITPKKTSQFFTFLFVGNKKLSKGLDVLVEAFDRLDLGCKRLIIIGAPGDYSVMETENIIVKPHISKEQLQTEYSLSDVFVLPSRLDGFGQVVLEAMATATPVIVSDRVGAKDAIKHGENGWIFPSGDVGALTKLMFDVWENRHKLPEIGVNASIKARQYTWEKYRRDVVDLLFSLKANSE